MTVNYDEQANHYEETKNVIPLVYSTLIAIIKPKANEKILGQHRAINKVLSSKA